MTGAYENDVTIDDWVAQVFHGAQKRQGCSSCRSSPGFLAGGPRTAVESGACVGGGSRGGEQHLFRAFGRGFLVLYWAGLCCKKDSVVLLLEVLFALSGGDSGLF